MDNGLYLLKLVLVLTIGPVLWGIWMRSRAGRRVDSVVPYLAWGGLATFIAIVALGSLF